MIGTLGAKSKAIFTLTEELLGWVGLALKGLVQLIMPRRRRIFWLLFKRQLFNSSFKALPLISVLAAILAWLMMSRALIFFPNNTQLLDYYAQLFVVVVFRDLGPFIAGVILIARSASAVTAEIGHMRLYQEFEALDAVNMNPVLTFLLPVLFAFSLGLALLSFYFALFCIVASYIFIAVFNDGVISLAGFSSALYQKVSVLDVTAFFVKTWGGGFLIGLTSVYYGQRVDDRFTDVSRAIASANTTQIFGFFLLNALIAAVVFI